MQKNAGRQHAIADSQDQGDAISLAHLGREVKAPESKLQVLEGLMRKRQPVGISATSRGASTDDSVGSTLTRLSHHGVLG